MSVSATTNLNITNEIITNEINYVLNKLEFQKGIKIADTLQGSIWRILKQNLSLVLKVTSQHLHKQSTATVNGKHFKVAENIISEQNILKHLTQQKDCPDSILKHHRFFKTKTHFFFLMEDGGESNLCDFSRKAHELIRKGSLDHEHWKQVTKIIFKQMFDCIDYIHSKNVCHLDVSLQNFLINDVTIQVDVYDDNKQKIHFAVEEIKIKLCDFGVAKIFSKDSNFRCHKWCGKNQYMSPELLSTKTYNAKKNDIWGLGICLFLLNIGSAPWKQASKKSSKYNYVMSHSIGGLLEYWNIVNLYDNDLVFLMNGMLKYETDRINLKDIKKYIGQYMK